jgi:PAS domain S-box-containing protein
MRLLVESIRDYAIFALDAQGHVQSWNLGAERAKGYSAGEIIGRHLSVFYTPEDIQAGRPERLLGIARTEGRVEDLGWRVRKDGSLFWADVVITALRDEQGQLLGFAKVTRDLTEQRKAETALKESEERFRMLVTSVKDYGIFMLDPNGYVRSWNEGAQRIKGYTASDIIGRHFSTFYPPEEVAAAKPAMELRVAAAEGRFEDEGWRLRKDGTSFWANVIITAVRNDSNELVGYAKVTRDLTERRAAEQRAIADARRLAEAEASSRAKSEFLAAMSHELRTPLNAIGGYAELMEMGIHGPVTAEQRESLDRIQRSQRMLLGLINQVLNYARIETGNVRFNLADISLDDTIRATEALVMPQLTAKELTYRWAPPGGAVTVHADRDKLQQIVLNLLGNAIKFTAPGGRIDLAVAAHGDQVTLRVSDTGIGIAPDKLGSIFDPFVQVDPHYTRTRDGVGLGLAISRDLARGMGGELTAESTLGAGSTFTLRLPRRPAVQHPLPS